MKLIVGVILSVVIASGVEINGKSDRNVVKVEGLCVGGHLYVAGYSGGGGVALTQVFHTTSRLGTPRPKPCKAARKRGSKWVLKKQTRSY